MSEIKRKPGRPVVENSNRQLELKKKAELRSLGLIKRGRPIVEDSNRQLELQRKQEMREQGLLKLGRPKQQKED